LYAPAEGHESARCVFSPKKASRRCTGGRHGTIARWTETQECGNNRLDSRSVFQALDCSCSDHPVRIGILVCARTSDVVAEDHIEDDRKWFLFTSLSMERSGRIHPDQFWRFDLVAIRPGDLSVTCPDVACGSMVEVQASSGSSPGCWTAASTVA